MTIKVRHEGATKSISVFKVMYGGALRTIRSVKVMEGDTLRTVALFAPPLSLSISPAFASGSVSSPFPELVSTGYVTATPAGGISPFSYSWSISGVIEASNPSNASTSFSAAVDPATTLSSTATCTVTDAFGSTAAASIPVTIRNVSGA